MKMLLDENLPFRLYKEFPPEYQVFSVKYMGWEGLKNGKLLQVMQAEKFDALITWDKKLAHQQNFEKYPITVFCFQTPTAKFDFLKTLIPQILAAIKQGVKPGLVSIQ